MLEHISTSQLKKMTISQLTELCGEIREKIIKTVFSNGGHLSSNLGMVELTVALHYVFDLPYDKIIFDVGHQCYTHKLLTGRYDKFDTLRQKGGISGFPKREESEFDCYNTGHAGTSISAALGIAKARDVKGENFDVVAVIGDGSFNNGLIYEAFNSVRTLNSNILVILNDNGMSISPTVGTMHEYLESLSKTKVYADKKVRHATIFERFGFVYDGVYDGNDLKSIIDRLVAVKELLKDNSVILHLYTKKGKGYEFCEENPEATHGISGANSSNVIEYSSVLGETLTQLADNDDRIIAVTAAMTSALGLDEFFNKYPERAIDVGICEEHATILCSGLATQGLKPYYAVYSTFLQRSFDEIMIDICSQDLPVTMCIDRAGVSGADGETHQGVFDLSFLNLIPNLTIAVPKDVHEFREMLKFSPKFEHPLAIRYPRSGVNKQSNALAIESTTWEQLESGDGDFVIIACGERAISMAYYVRHSIENIGKKVAIINARFIKPLDFDTLKSIKENNIITIEDNVLIGGLGAQIAQYYACHDKKVKNFAFEDKFLPHAKPYELMDEYGLNVVDVINYIKNEN